MSSARRTAIDSFVISRSDTIGLWLGPSLMTGLPLDASDAVIKLRDCASKIAENDASDRQQQ
jgi:hypothetical protein